MRYKFEDGKIVIHAPGDERETFLEFVEDFFAPPEDDFPFTYWQNGKSDSDFHFLLGRLYDCTDVLPAEYCETMELLQGSTYGQAARKLKKAFTEKKEDESGPIEAEFIDVVTQPDLDDSRPIWPGRFTAWATVAKFPWRGGYFKDVVIKLFRHDMTEEEARRLLAESGAESDDDGYLLSQVEETFSQEEIDQIRPWVESADESFTVEPARIPAKGYCGISAVAVGGTSDFVMFDYGPDYPLDFKVWGYYNLDAHEEYPAAIDEVTF